MKIRNLFFTLTAAMGLCAYGAAAQTSTETPVTNIIPQTDPLVIELDSFENRNFGKERAYIIICDNIVKGQIPTVTGMVSSRSFASACRYALQFDECSARVTEPRFNKKGTQYNFTVHVDDAQFFDSIRDSDWRLSFTINGGGFVTLRIESAVISNVRSTPSWTFQGHVNAERTEALKMITGR